MRKNYATRKQRQTATRSHTGLSASKSRAWDTLDAVSRTLASKHAVQRERYKAKLATKGEPITRKQVRMLHRVLGNACQRDMIRWLEFSNGYISGAKPQHGWTRIHAVRAISMALDGKSDEFSFEYLLALSFDPDAQPEDYTPAAKPLWLQRKLRRNVFY